MLLEKILTQYQPNVFCNQR